MAEHILIELKLHAATTVLPVHANVGNTNISK